MMKKKKRKKKTTVDHTGFWWNYGAHLEGRISGNITEHPDMWPCAKWKGHPRCGLKAWDVPGLKYLLSYLQCRWMDNETTKLYMFFEACVVESALWTTSLPYIQSQPGNILCVQCDCAPVHLIVVLYASRSSNQYQPGTGLFLHFGCLRVSIVYAHIVRRALLESEKKPSMQSSEVAHH